jgi:hypothetical protein
LLDPKIVQLISQNVDFTSNCLWDALLLSLIDANILKASAEPPNIKEQCLAYMKIKSDDKNTNQELFSKPKDLTEEQYRVQRERCFKPEWWDTCFIVPDEEPEQLADFFKVCVKGVADQACASSFLKQLTETNGFGQSVGNSIRSASCSQEIQLHHSSFSFRIWIAARNSLLLSTRHLRNTLTKKKRCCRVRTRCERW